jgi:putative solute:sodium symporter small subunit
MARLEAGGHWGRTRLWAIVAIAIWLSAGMAVPLMLTGIAAPEILGLPPGLFLAAFGTPLLFVVLAVWFSRRQEIIDRDTAASDGS